MTYTSHGHHIPNSPEDLSDIPPRARCGGPGLCGLCSSESSIWNQANDRDKFIGSLDEARQHQGILIPRLFVPKPISVKAIQFLGGASAGMDIEAWVKANGGNATWRNAALPWTSPQGTEGHSGWPETLSLETPNGWVEIRVGWWISQGSDGYFYPYNNVFFKENFEEI